MVLNTFYDKFYYARALRYKNGNFFLDRLPFLICPAVVLAGLLEPKDPAFGRKLYYSVKASVSRHLIPTFGGEFGLHGEKMVAFLEKYFFASGWGAIKNIDVDFESKKAIVVVSSNPFSANLSLRPTMPADHILRGIFAGIFTSAFESDVECVETHCSALGEKDCEFIVKKQHEFDLSDKRVRQQLELKV